MAVDIRLIPCLSDNYAVLMKTGSGAVILVDAPESGPILAELEKQDWSLTHILVTHRHNDHIDGIPDLVAAYSPEVIAPAAEAAQIPNVTKTVKEGDEIQVGGLKVRVFETPGHTSGHVSYYLPEEKLLFSGDTLFALGCGRLFEGSPAQMWHSLLKLRNLPDDVSVYFGHEYTLSNAKFAVTVDPGNETLKARCAEIEKLRSAGQPTIPTTLGVERATNPFLRADDPSVAEAVGHAGAAAEDVFAEVRGRKDRF